MAAYANGANGAWSWRGLVVARKTWSNPSNMTDRIIAASVKRNHNKSRLSSGDA